jgi:MGT family glycosyltransferase
VGYNPQSIVGFSPLLDSILWAYGFEESGNFWHSEDLNFYQLPRELQFNADSIDSRRFCFVGPFLDRPFTPVWKDRSGGKPVLLVSAVPGRDANYFNKFIDALSGSEFHVILSVGQHSSMSGLRKIPNNFEVNRCASHLEILPHTDLHLYSGGPTGTLEGFYFGVPLIAIPSDDHNYLIVDRLAELGFVRRIPIEGLTGQAIRENAEAVLKDDVFLSRVKQMQSVVRNSGGSVMAVDRIEEFLAGRTGTL